MLTQASLISRLPPSALSFLEEVLAVFRWWLTTLWDLVPQTLQEHWAGHPKRILIYATNVGLRVAVETRDGRYEHVTTEAMSQSLKYRSLRKLLVVSAKDAMTHRESLPPMSLAQSLAALKLRLPEISPVDPASVMAVACRSEHEKSGQAMNVYLAARGELEQTLEWLTVAGGTASGILIDDGSRLHEAIPLTDEGKYFRASISRQTILLYVLFALSTILAFTSLLDRLDRRAELLDKQVFGLRAETTDAREQAEAYEKKKVLLDLIISEIEKPSPLSTLQQLAARVPETAYLAAIKFEGRNLTIEGVSDQGPDLEAALAGRGFQSASLIVSIDDAPASSTRRFRASLLVHE